MRWISDQGLNCLQFPALADLPDFFHGIFLRTAQDGPGRCYDFNVALGRGISKSSVRQNREKMLAFFGAPYRGLYARQVHGKNVGIPDHRPAPGKPDAHCPDRLDGDALITDQAGWALVIQVADCQPVMIIDPERGVVANIHSGWRGSIQNIIGTTIHRMAADFKCRTRDLICGVGPSLGPCCAEFINYRNEIPEAFWKYRRADDLFDFWQISVDQMVGAGVRPENISLSGMCTKCNPHLFFSYRGERHTGRFAAVVGIRSGKGIGA